jgi:Pentapeptide repeats (8 copies)
LDIEKEKKIFRCEMSDPDLEKEKLFHEIKKLKREEKWFWLTSTPGLALILAVVTLGVSGYNLSSTSADISKLKKEAEKLKAEAESLRVKPFYDLLHTATNQNGSEAERIGALWGLQQGFWWDDTDQTSDKKAVEILAATLSSILLTEDKLSVMEATVDGIGHAYQDPKLKDSKIKKQIKVSLYGDKSTGEVGAVLHALEQALRRKPEEDKQHVDRLHYFAQAISINGKDLEGVNFHGAKLGALTLNLDNANLQKADLRACDLSKVSLVEADLRDVDVDGSTKFDGANLDRAKTSNDYIERNFNGEYLGTVATPAPAPGGKR